MDALAALRLQLEWGADEALADAPIDRFRVPPVAPPAPVAAARPAAPVERAAAPPPRGAAAVARAAELAAAADTLDALRAALAGFDGCALRDTAANLVFADGEAASGLMLVGDAPAEAEERAGRPFAGPAGVLLDRMLASIGLDRTQARIGMLVPWRPPGGRPPTEAEIAVCLPFLLRHVALVQPRRLLLLGSMAARAVLNGSVTARRLPRGEWVRVKVPGLPQPVPGLVSASPSLLLSKAAEKRRAWADLRLVRRALNAELTNS